MARGIIRQITAILAVLTIFISPRLSSSAFADEFDHSHSAYDSLLKKYVHDANVDYQGFINSGEEFNTYLKQLGSVNEKVFDNWSKEEKLTFWINAYNAFTIKAIIDHYPIKKKLSLASLIYPESSIRQIDGVWDKLKFQAAGKAVTLNEIEHEILRKKFDEPRIHVAIVCASFSCPDLRGEAYKADRINEQLENQAAEFINNPKKGVEIKPEEGKVKVSKIFNWFGADFIGKYGSTESFAGRDKQEKAVLNFVMTYLQSEEQREFLKSSKFGVSYLDYDWSLNDSNDKTPS